MTTSCKPRDVYDFIKSHAKSVCFFFIKHFLKYRIQSFYSENVIIYIHCNIYMTHYVIVYGGLICYILPSLLITLDYMRSLNEPPSYVTHYLVFYWWNSSRNKKKCHSWANFLYKLRPHTAKIPAQTSLCRSKIERLWLAIEHQWTAIIDFLEQEPW